MEHRKLGSSDLELPVLGAGSGFSRIKDASERDRMVGLCLELGIKFFDTADAYLGGEEALGEALKGRRHQALINTSFDLRPGNSRSQADAPLRAPQTPRERIFSSVEISLKKLQTDYIDLYHIHHREPGVHPEVILEPLNDLVKQGKVRYIGEGNYAAWQHALTNAAARHHGWAEMQYIQSYYSVARRHAEMETLPYCTSDHVSMFATSALAYGFLSGRYSRGTPVPEEGGVNPGRQLEYFMQSERHVNMLEELTEYAQDHGYTIGQLAYAWVLAHPAVSMAIVGESSEEALRSTVKALDWKMTREERDEIDRIALWDGTGDEVEEPGDHRREYSNGKFGRGFWTIEGRQPPQR